MVFRAVIIPTLFYACETRTLYQKDLKKLEGFQQAKLRLILNIKWQDQHTNNEVLNRSKMSSIAAAILKHCLGLS